MKAGRRLFSKAFFTTKTTFNIYIYIYIYIYIIIYIYFFKTRFTSLVEFNSEIKNTVFLSVPVTLEYINFWYKINNH